MLFSFIVPVYNTSEYLDQCMKSLLCQKGADFEIVLINDGSTDNSGTMCDAYAEQYPDIVRVIHKENEGLLLTRRRGFKEAKGEWFICTDSDDYVEPQLLSSVMHAINEYQPDMVMYNFQYFSNSGVTTKSRLNIPDKSIYISGQKQKVYENRLLTDDINSLCCKVLKREIVDIDADYSECGIRNMSEDAVQVLPLFTNAQKIVYLSSPLYNYRKGDSSITSSRSFESWMASKTCFLITEQYLDIWRVSDELRKKFYTHNCEVLSNFVRWLFSQPEASLPESQASIIHTICESDAFCRCMEMYNRSYAQTTYLKLSVPIIMKYIKKEKIRDLCRFFSIERKLISNR